MGTLLKKPSAWMPLIMSGAAFAFVVGYVLFVGIPETPPEDEGTPAHIFQLLMSGQLPIIVFFAITNLPKAPKQALQVLAMQFLAGLLAFSLVFFLEM